jgi:hypothetical protein
VPVLVPGVAVRSRRSTLLVENDLAVGSWLFRLTVVDDAGLESGPADLLVRVVAARPRPVPVVDPVPVVPERASPTRTSSRRRRTRAQEPAPKTVRPPKPDGPARPSRRPSRPRKKPKP